LIQRDRCILLSGIYNSSTAKVKSSGKFEICLYPLLSILVIGMALAACSGSPQHWHRVQAVKKIAVIQVSANKAIESSAEGEGARMQKGILAFSALAKGKNLAQAAEAAVHTSSKRSRCRHRCSFP
jgi:hypothetical protein